MAVGDWDYPAIVAGLVYNRTEPTNYSYTTRNRVETATAAMADLISSVGYYAVLQCKMDWANITTRTWANWPSRENITRYLENVKTLEKQFFSLPGVVLPDIITNIDVAGANAIEEFLANIPSMVDDLESHYRRCNTFRCGT